MQTAMLLLHRFKGSYIVARDQFGCPTNSRGRPFWLSYLDSSPLIWHVDVVRLAAHRLSGKEVLSAQRPTNFSLSRSDRQDAWKKWRRLLIQPRQTEVCRTLACGT